MNTFVINVQHVAHAGKGKVRDGRWQNNIVMRAIEMHAQRAQGEPNIFKDKVTVLEESQQPQVGHKAADKQPFSMNWILSLTQLAPNVIIRQRSEN